MQTFDIALGHKAKYGDKSLIFELKFSYNDGKNERIVKIKRPGIPKKRPKMALEYVAEYNLNEKGTGFVKTHAYNDPEGISFTQYEALTKYYKVRIEGVDYHIPSNEELNGIFPVTDTKFVKEEVGNSHSISYNFISFEDKETKTFHAESIEINGDFDSYKAYYKSEGLNKTVYAIKMENGIKNKNKYRTAYRYQYFFDEQNNSSQLEIKCIYLGNNMNITIDDVANEVYWSTNPIDVTRIFQKVYSKNINNIDILVPEPIIIIEDIKDIEKIILYFSSTIKRINTSDYKTMSTYLLCCTPKGISMIEDNFNLDLLYRCNIRLFEGIGKNTIFIPNLMM